MVELWCQRGRARYRSVLFMEFCRSRLLRVSAGEHGVEPAGLKPEHAHAVISAEGEGVCAVLDGFVDRAEVGQGDAQVESCVGSAARRPLVYPGRRSGLLFGFFPSAQSDEAFRRVRGDGIGDVFGAVGGEAAGHFVR